MAAPFAGFVGSSASSAAQDEEDEKEKRRLRLKRSTQTQDAGGDYEDDFNFDLKPEEREGERASLDKFLPDSNVGYKLLLKMGWSAGTGLGRNGRGRLNPIPFNQKNDSMGVGKAEQEDRQLEEASAVRKLLEVEIEETEELKQKREAKAAREDEIRKELAEINKVFYCEICDKGYKKSADYESHLSSYDHGHKKRLKEMKEFEGQRGKDERSRKEQKREEKELQKIYGLASAMQQKAAPPLPSAPPPPPLPPTPPQTPNPPAAPVAFSLGKKPGTTTAVRPVLAKPSIFNDDDD